MEPLAHGKHLKERVKKSLALSGGKLVIIALDGASWRIIDTLVQRGQLLNLARLIRNGASGNLRSLEPMISAMLWTTISSGKLPDKHGVRDFAVSSRAVQCKRLWDIFGQQGLSVGVYGHMITWPPDPVKGFMVPGSLALGPETHPPYLTFLRRLIMDETSGSKRRYMEYLGYGWKALKNGVSSRTLWQLGAHHLRETFGRLDPLLSYFHKRLLKQRVDCEVFCYLCRKFKPQFAFFHTHLLDSSQHRFWKFMEPDVFPDVHQKDVARYGQIIPEAYRQADWAVGRILAALGDNTTVMIVSDHGGQAAQGAQERSVWTIKTEKLLNMLGLRDRVRAVNIGRTLYLCPKREKPEVRAQIARLFEGVVVSRTGARVFEVIPIEYSYLKIQAQQDKIPQQRGLRVQVQEKLCPLEEIVGFSSGKVSGTHHPDGICILWGKSIKAGSKLREASILDVTPTALMLMGLPVAKDMDGRALVEAITDHFLQTHPMLYRETYEEEGKLSEEEEEDVPMPEELVKKLKDLGYLQ